MRSVRTRGNVRLHASGSKKVGLRTGLLLRSMFDPYCVGLAFPFNACRTRALHVVAGYGLVWHQKPIESGFFWSLLAAAVAFHAGAVGRGATLYLATAALIMLASVVETSYLMAYYDELTGVPARRAFNDALLALEFPYAIAVVDIDLQGFQRHIWS